MKRNRWSATFSIGVITYTSVPENVDDVIRKADDIMYYVKKNGKNMLKHETVQ
ncbi:diguanylate cyclase, partial [Candidatus Peregrinibacteria bacterium]|nr:diguanylate cyclase [Candidatus Peregrinibacteria bacterium]